MNLFLFAAGTGLGYLDGADTDIIQNTREFRRMWVAVSCGCHGDVGD